MKQILSNSNIQIIRTFLDNQLTNDNRVVVGDLWKAIISDDSFSEFNNESKFKKALIKAFNDDKFPGLITVRGRYGGIRRVKNGANGHKKVDRPVKLEKAVKLSPQGDKPLESGKKAEKAAAKTAPLVKEAKSPEKEVGEFTPDPDKIIFYPKLEDRKNYKWNDLWISGRQYRHTMTFYQMRFFMKHVIEVEESSKGNVKAFDKTYSCTEEQCKLLDALLFYCFGAQFVITSSK